MSEVVFWAMLNNKILLVTARSEDSLAKFFKGLRNDADVAEHIPTKVSYTACKFYQLKTPVSVLGGGNEDEQQDDVEEFPDAVMHACLEESNRVTVNPGRTLVRQLAKPFSGDHIYLVIDFPDPLKESNEAIGKLREEHNSLFKCLQVTVEKLQSWRITDVERNLQGGIHTDDDHGLPPEFREIQEALAKKRVYRPEGAPKAEDAPNAEGVLESVRAPRPDLRNAQIYKTQFDDIFVPLETVTELPTVINDREFAAFYNVLRCFNEDVPRIVKKGTSSALKASNFTVHFVQPPFFSENDGTRGFEYHQEKSWNFPIFLETTSARNAWRKLTPRSDWMVISSLHTIPFVISEVISGKEQEDRNRMLVEAIALTRAGQFLLRSASRSRFFVVAIYVDAKMVASRYIVMQTGRDNAGDANRLYRDKAVCIHRKDFDLAIKEQQVNFLREMYNLATQITVLSGEMDQLKKESLMNIKDVAQKVLSLSTKHPQTKTSGNTVMDSILEERRGSSNAPQDEDGLGVFEADDIQKVLHRMDYRIEFIPWGHPQLAVIVNKTGDKHGYLKFVEREREVEVLQYLTGIESPSNHTISGVRFWPVQGGTVISMPVAGAWLTSLDDPNKHLWSVALQLFEAVAFMHEHNVAHMDLKPQNVIIPTEGGRLSDIDFSVSIRVRGPDVEYKGVIGTEEYIAPEVRKGWFKPMLADLWSCGRTLEELCSLCGSSPERAKLLEIARRLMNPDPEARPKMSTVLEWMAPGQRGEDNVVSSTLRLFPTISPLCA